ncbi:MAG: hypothetical protein IJP74_07405 [Prevotella sp.]|nr:hypothetical protein [Prevotella sp.]
MNGTREKENKQGFNNKNINRYETGNKTADAVDAKKEYTLLPVSGSQDGGGEVTPVTPE